MLSQQQFLRQRAAGWARILGGPVGGSNTFYLSSTASGTVGTDNTLVTSPPNSETNNSTSIIGSGWFILFAQGGLGSSGGVIEPGQNDEGFLWDVTSLEGRTLPSGLYSGFLKLATISGSTGAGGADIHLRIAKRMANGSFSTIIDLVLAGQTITTGATVFAIPQATGPKTLFAVGDKLYADVLINLTNAGTATGFKLFQNGGTNESFNAPVSIGTIPSVAPTVIQPVAAMAEDAIQRGRPAEYWQFGGLPSRSATPPSLRNVVRADPLDTEGVTYWQRANETFITGGIANKPATPPTLRTPIWIPAEDVVTPQVPPYGIVIRRQGTYPSVPWWGHPLVCPAEDILTPPRNPEGVVLGGLPNKAVTPTSLRSVIYSLSTEDLFSQQRHPEGQIFSFRRNQPSSKEVPYVLVVPAEDNLSYQRHPYATILSIDAKGAIVAPYPVNVVAPEDQVSHFVPASSIMWTPFTTVVNTPTIPHPPRITYAEDSLTAALVTPPLLLWTRPNYPTVHPSQLIPGICQTEDTITPQGGQSWLARTWRFPPGTVPSLPITTVTPIDQQGVLYAGYQGHMYLVTSPVPPVTKSSLRPVNVVLAEDVLSQANPPVGMVYREIGFQLTLRPPLVAYTTDTLSEQVPAEGRIYGGKPSRSITPFSLRSPLVITAEDVFSPPRHPEGIIYGGKPAVSATTTSLRPPIIVLAEDVLTPPRHPEGTVLSGPRVGGKTPSILRPIIIAATEDVISPRRLSESLILSGPLISPVKGVPKVNVVLAEDTFSLQRLSIIVDPILQGGKPSKPTTPVSLRPTIVIPAEDILSPIPPPSTIYGGKPNSAVTPLTLREIIRGWTPDVYSTENTPPPVMLAGLPFTVVSKVPVTRLSDIYTPTIKITGKVGGTTNG